MCQSGDGLPGNTNIWTIQIKIQPVFTQISVEELESLLAWLPRSMVS